MDATHLHLVITHLPVYGTIFGILVLAYALWTKSRHTALASYFIFLASCAGAFAAYYTGEGAEHRVEKIAGISKDAIERHEHFAIYPLISFIVLAVLSLTGIILLRRQTSKPGLFNYVIVLAALISFGLVSRTAALGGEIRHTEIKEQPIQPSTPAKKTRKSDDD